MDKIRVKNYRSILDSGMVSLKPITIMVGRNSAGKSSIIRLLPLLKQTLEKKTAEPILWYGDYVDFGDYSKAISSHKKNDSIIISFEIEYSHRYRYINRERFAFKNNLAYIELSVKEKRFDRIKITISDQIIDIKIDDNDKTLITINGVDSLFDGKDLIALNEYGGLLPTIFSKPSSNRSYIGPDITPIKMLKDFARYVYDKSPANDHFLGYNMVRSIEVGSREEMLEQFKRENPEKFKNRNINNKTIIKYNNYALAIKLNDIISSINTAIQEELKQTSYIKPIRASIDRYYRLQGVRVDELDADGGNIPMILSNMNETSLKRFEKWSKLTFGIIFSISKTEGHASLIIKNNIEGTEKINVADTGYGYSQMLPIVLLLWMIHEDRTSIYSSRKKTIIIEQPELHLHPAYQAKMMDVFAKVVSEAQKQNIAIKIIFETHSETMINRLGELIAANRFKKEDVNVLFFEKEDDETKITSKSYDDDGLLKGWPIDFFAPEVLF